MSYRVGVSYRRGKRTTALLDELRGQLEDYEFFDYARTDTTIGSEDYSQVTNQEYENSHINLILITDGTFDSDDCVSELKHIIEIARKRRDSMLLIVLPKAGKAWERYDRFARIHKAHGPRLGARFIKDWKKASEEIAELLEMRSDKVHHASASHHSSTRTVAVAVVSAVIGGGGTAVAMQPVPSDSSISMSVAACSEPDEPTPVPEVSLPEVRPAPGPPMSSSAAGAGSAPPSDGPVCEQPSVDVPPRRKGSGPELH